MKVLNIQEISNVSGGATTQEIMHTGLVYGGGLGAVLGTVVGVVLGADAGSSGMRGDPVSLVAGGLALGSIAGFTLGGLLGVVFSFPFAALYGENLYSTKK